MTTPISEAKGIPPSEYTAFLDRLMARYEAEVRKQRRKARIEAAVIAIALSAIFWGAVMWWRACH